MHAITNRVYQLSKLVRFASFAPLQVDVSVTVGLSVLVASLTMVHWLLMPRRPAIHLSFVVVLTGCVLLGHAMLAGYNGCVSVGYLLPSLPHPLRPGHHDMVFRCQYQHL